MFSLGEKMKTEYQYISFVAVKQNPKTTIWNCINNKSKTVLCGVAYYPAWRQYVMYTSPTHNSIFNNTCLADIQNFIEQCNAELKNNRG
jgi:hypothetical protein